MNENLNFWQSKKFGQFVIILVFVAILFMVMKTVNEFKKSSYIGSDSISQNLITVSGKGEAFAKPDTATFSFTVEKEAKVVADAQKASDETIKEALEFLKKSGVEEKDTKTTSYQIYPNYEYGSPVICNQWGCPPQKPPVISGYKVSQTIEVKVRDIGKAGELLSGIGAVGVTNLSGLNFSIDDEDAIQAKARKEAIDKAEAKAKELSKQLGVKIVRVMNFSESGSYPPIFYAKAVTGSEYGMGGDNQSVSVAPGETRVVSNVTITYEIR